MAVLNNRSSLSTSNGHDTFVQMPPTAENLDDSAVDLQQLSAEDTTTGKPSLRSLFVFTTRKHSIAIIIAVFSSFLSALLKPASAIIFGKVFSIFTKFGSGALNGRDALAAISQWCIALVGLGGSAWIIEATFLSSWMVFGELQAKSVREQLFVGMLDKEMACQVRELQMGVSQPMGFLVYELFGALAALGLAFYYSWKLSLVIIATFPFAGLLFFLVSIELGSAIEAQKRELTKASKFANTAITAINTVKVYNGQNQEVWQYYDTIKKVAAAYLIQARCNAAQFGITKFLMVGLFVQGFWFGLVLVKKGMDPGAILTTFYACLAAMQGLETVLPQWLVLKKGMSAGQTLKAIMMQVKKGRVMTSMMGSLRPDSCVGDIEIKGVSFAYPSNVQQNVLNEADFFFPAGETTFIVGRSGSGKSTLSNLLMKYYEPTRGEILVDGNPISILDSTWLRKNITLVQQQSILFNETVLQNIEFGGSQPAARRDILQATRTADLEQTLLELPEGLHTIVGSNGKSLSGGQQQRIAIARARLRDAPIVILDESTSALDQTSREKVSKTIREWRKRKTTIVITHDVTQIMDDEYVYVLEHGVVVQEGYRKKLAEKKHGTFASFLPEAQTPDLGNPLSDTRRYSMPSSPSSLSSPIVLFDERLPQHEGLFSRFLGLQPTNPHGFVRTAASPAIALGDGFAQVNALRASRIWATPSAPTEDGIFPSFRSSEHQRPEGERKRESITLPGSTQKFSPGPQPDEWILLLPVLAVSRTKGLRIRPPAINTSVPVRTVTHSPIALTIQPPQDSETSSKIPLERKPASLKGILGTIWPTLRWKGRCILCLGFATALIVAGGTPAFAYVFAKLLQVYYEPVNQDGQALKWALSLLAIAIVDGFATFCSHYALEYSGQAWVNTLRVEALKRIMAQPRSWFDKERNSTSRLNECLDRNAEEMRNLIGRFSGPIFTTFWMLTASIVWAFVISWKLTLVATACGPVIYVVTRTFNWVSSKWEDKSNHASDVTSSIFTETFANIRVVRALTLEDHFKKKHSKATADTYKTGMYRSLYSGTLFGLVDALTYLITALIFYYGAMIVTRGEIPVSSILEVANLLLFGIANAVSMLNLVPQINTSRTTATHMLYLANLPLNSSHETTGETRLASPFPIIFNNLSFTYPGRPKTLSGISLSIEAGSCIALVGPSGSGKSSIASLLLGLYSPNPSRSDQAAPLTFNNIAMHECNMATLRSFIAFVPQHPLLFPASILSNIIYGLAEGSPFSNSASASLAAEEAGIHEFVMSLPMGYATMIGDGGMGLSGGQAQRIAIARALVRRPKVLVLDEATSALDAVSAEAVRDTVRKLLERGRDAEEGGMAVLLISHGVEMMKIASEVVVIESGRVVERGGFEELKRKGGAFSRLIGVKVNPVEGDFMRDMTPVTGKGRNRESWAWLKRNSM
ncbi:related to STE6-`Full-size` ABC transporter responsible for export of the `a` factor mating pheromone [Rhynchosporium graminicola]|uniref:Related to STE6-`Full-size` ABC transporter responsible for export of the `a` factor mating pheromone n=1 Tax=Rhynchosporium graminicola TaxID=2792576 RepID=A0A1E1LGF5_9HELO|nr:related to STE6-`Full-size` ABC transporter responsible for export of the `a` factor mating pheromone [Rhynchosporium commune]